MMQSLIVALALAMALVGCNSSSGAAPTGSVPEVPAATTTTSTPDTGPQEQSIDIDGRSLYVECQGSGSPTVILEAGLTGDHRTWEHVLPALAESTRACAYDRANIAPSDPAATPRTAQDAVDDLHALLDRAALDPPYVMVGFSFGGLISQLYAATYPDEIAGLILVESSHPDEAEQFEAHLTPTQIEEDRAATLENSEGIDPFASFEEVQAAPPLPPVPLVVVTAGVSEGWPPGWDPATFDRLRAEQQADLATLSPGGRQVLAEESSHHIPSQQPGVIIEAVEAVLAEAR
jgi:pimeloyl-ACP methyl ester carboxylesterase